MIQLLYCLLWIMLLWLLWLLSSVAVVCQESVIFEKWIDLDVLHPETPHQTMYARQQRRKQCCCCWIPPLPLLLRLENDDVCYQLLLPWMQQDESLHLNCEFSK